MPRSIARPEWNRPAWFEPESLLIRGLRQERTPPARRAADFLRIGRVQPTMAVR
jgi:hypothetical protein